MSILPYILLAVSLGIIALIVIGSLQYESNKYDAVKYLAEKSKEHSR